MSNKPQITATIKFRDVTIENMTIEELKALRDVLNTLVGDEKEYVPYPQPYPVYPSQPWWMTTSSSTLTLSGNAGISFGDGTHMQASDNVHYTLKRT